MSTGIVWFRQDLRLADNPALFNATKNFKKLILIYIHAPGEAKPWSAGGASQWWLHHSLKSLDSSIRQLGGKLILRCGSSEEQLLDIISQSQADTVYFNRQYEPALVKRDHSLVNKLRRIDVKCHIYNGSLLLQPEDITTQAGTPYRVFTPFWRKTQPLLPQESPLPAPSSLKKTKNSLNTLKLNEFDLVSSLPWYNTIEQTWHPGESSAHNQLETFCDQALFNYNTQRDRPDIQGTSSLSAYLRFGELSPKQILWQLHIAENESPSGSLASMETYSKELIWREFAYYILHHFPDTTSEPLNKRYQNFPYKKTSSKLLRAWQTGMTGYPLVDAGMRQLWKTGWMHNRVRMIVASFLTKNMLHHWRHGASWFWDTLVDADLANNSFNWQWAAGCGADAAPYFRIFNPITQSKKFDPDGVYIKWWIPELRSLPDQYIHEPWKTPTTAQTTAKIIIGKDYPAPILDLKTTRKLALETYNQFSNQKI